MMRISETDVPERTEQTNIIVLVNFTSAGQFPQKSELE